MDSVSKGKETEKKKKKSPHQLRNIIILETPILSDSPDRSIVGYSREILYIVVLRVCISSHYISSSALLTPPHTPLLDIFFFFSSLVIEQEKGKNTVGASINT